MARPHPARPRRHRAQHPRLGGGGSDEGEAVFGQGQLD